MFRIIRRYAKKRARKIRLKKYDEKEIKEVYDFCCRAKTLRTPENCSSYFVGKYSVQKCKDIIEELFETGRMGAYCLCEGPPQEKMRQWILENYPIITNESNILEVGPGDHPLFDENDYPNWYGCDYNYDEGVIRFSGNVWGKDKYKKIAKGSWENLSDVRKHFDRSLEYDLVCGSHSFEHNHMPIKAIKEASKILKTGGLMICFVPDGYSTWEGNYDRTHTLYMTSEMAIDLFDVIDDMQLIECKSFRTNMDLVFVARKI